jgi:hypothetical protein
MAYGSGKYDKEATALRESAKAVGVCVIILDGDRGSGFSVQVPAGCAKEIAGILRDAAAQLDKDLVC